MFSHYLVINTYQSHKMAYVPHRHPVTGTCPVVHSQSSYKYDSTISRGNLFSFIHSFIHLINQSTN